MFMEAGREMETSTVITGLDLFTQEEKSEDIGLRKWTDDRLVFYVNVFILVQVLAHAGSGMYFSPQ